MSEKGVSGKKLSIIEQKELARKLQEQKERAEQQRMINQQRQVDFEREGRFLTAQAVSAAAMLTMDEVKLFEKSEEILRYIVDAEVFHEIYNEKYEAMQKRIAEQKEKEDAEKNKRESNQEEPEKSEPASPVKKLRGKA